MVSGAISKLMAQNSSNPSQQLLSAEFPMNAGTGSTYLGDDRRMG